MPRLENALFDIALVEPEIPNNTGNIGRTCVAAGCRLHLIHPLGFDTDEKACRRAGLDYWPRLDVTHHKSWEQYSPTVEADRTWILTTKAVRTIYETKFERGDTFIFGKETAGLAPGILESYPGRLVRLPMIRGERSLNLATVVCAVVYEGMRQLIARGEVSLGADGALGLE